ncbi:hypothetical protein Z043_106928, partial [Scleropages formosus]
MKIPVVDFEACASGEKNPTDEELVRLSAELRAAFTRVGFVYLRNTCVTQEEVDAVMDISKKFFLLPEEVKMPFSRKESNNHGWVSSESERLNPHRPGDLKEAFNIASLEPDENWPSEEILPGFREAQQSFFVQCKDLSLQVLRVMALSLGLDADVFTNEHKLIGSKENGSTLRALYYPPVNYDTVKEGQLRCGEHSDYGSITLVFQSREGGLQVKTRSGDFISAPSIPGTVLINIADLMQRWTGDIFVSAAHRVLLPLPGNVTTRQSLAFFVQPDNEAVIKCYDGSDKYPPIKAVDYLWEHLGDSYGL